MGRKGKKGKEGEKEKRRAGRWDGRKETNTFYLLGIVLRLEDTNTGKKKDGHKELTF